MVESSRITFRACSALRIDASPCSHTCLLLIRCPGSAATWFSAALNTVQVRLIVAGDSFPAFADAPLLAGAGLVRHFPDGALTKLSRHLRNSVQVRSATAL